jgi:hypothetical protein
MRNMTRHYVAHYALAGSLAVALFSAIPGSAEAQQSQPAAIVQGQAITEDELAPLIQTQVQQIRVQEYQLKARALESLIFQKLVEAQAKAKGVTAEKLLDEEVNAKAPEPSDTEVESYASQP